MTKIKHSLFYCCLRAVASVAFIFCAMELRNENVSFYVQPKIPVPLRLDL